MIRTATHWGNFQVDEAGDGTITISPVAQDSEPSPIGRSLASSHDPKSRVAQPVVRLGYYKHRRASDTTMRGRAPFMAVSWDEALDIAADALGDARALGGNRAIYGGSYGWASAGRFHHAQSQIHRFLNGFGGYSDAAQGRSRTLRPLLATSTRLLVSGVGGSAADAPFDCEVQTVFHFMAAGLAIYALVMAIVMRR